MFLAVQYYRPPTPKRQYWADDLSRIRDTGLDGIQLWCVWGWIEPEPGRFEYGDYDELVQLADERGLKVVLSTVAEVQPFWIHREVPGCELVDCLRRRIVSGPRAECNVGLSPGGCFDHPGAAERMRAFLTNIGSRYGSTANVVGWDCWNETRWNVHAEAMTCYCEHSLASFAVWLRDRYDGDLPALNVAWGRRYATWADVQPPKRTGGPFGDWMDFCRFQTARATRHARWRYEAIRAGGATQPITAHGPMPTIHCPPVAAEIPMCRGNDWELADVLDGVGSSHFPISQAMAEGYVGTRLQEVRSAVGPKRAWTSEMQASSSTIGYGRARTFRGNPLKQGQWIARAMALGYELMIFWQWRDESFCRESGTGGLAGRDGLAEPRIEAMQRTSAFIDRHRELLAAATPEPPRVGVLVNLETYYLDFARCGEVWDSMHSVVGYGWALERLGVPYEFVEAGHLDVVAQLDVLLMPWCLTVPAEVTAAVERLLARGGSVLVEAEADAFDGHGFFRDADERPLPGVLGFGDLGRRPRPPGNVLTGEVDGESFELTVEHFTTPLAASQNADILAVNAAGEPLLVRQSADEATVWALGAFAGRAYYADRTPGLETLLRAVVRGSGVRLETPAPGECGVYRRAGRSGEKSLLWVVNTCDDESRTVTVHVGDAIGATELFRDESLPVVDGRVTVAIPPGEFAVVCW